MRPLSHHLLHGLIPTRDILDPDVSYSETTLQEKAILAIWIILWISLAGAGIIIVCAIPASAAEINPSVDTIPFQCRYSFTQWLCDDKAGPAGAQGINGTPGTPGAGNFSAIYYNASNFTAYQNTTLIFGNITTGNNTINSNYTVIQGASFFNTTAINESYAYLPGRAGGQTFTGGTQTGDDLILNAVSSPSAGSDVLIQQVGGKTGIGGIARTTASLNVTGDEWIQSYLSVYNPTSYQTFDALGSYNGLITIIRLGNNNADTLNEGTYIGLVGASSITQTRIGSYWDTMGTNNGTLVIENRYKNSVVENARLTSEGKLGIRTIAPTSEIDIGGNLRIRGLGAGTLNTDSGGNVTAVSDSKAKTNIRPFTSALSAVKALESKSYQYSSDSGLDTKNTYVGFIAQDVEKVIPDAVKTKDDVKYVQSLKSKGATSEEDVYETIEVKTGTTTKSLDDRAIIAALVNALKEEDAKVQALEARIAVLEKSSVKP